MLHVEKFSSSYFIFIFPPTAEIVEFLYLTINGTLSMRYIISFGMSGNSKRQNTYHQYEKIKYLYTEILKHVVARFLLNNY